MKYFFVAVTTFFFISTTAQASICPSDIDLESVLRSTSEHSETPIDELNVSRWFKTNKTSKGVMLIIHGLNNNPHNFNRMSELLNGDGIDVLRVGLLGHRGDMHEATSVDLELIRHQVFLNFCVAKNYADNHELPIYLLGYSLGGALVVDLIEEESAEANHVILLAPSIKIHKQAKLTRIAQYLPKSWRLPSRMDKKYRANDYTTFAIYDIAWQAQKAVNESGFTKSKKQPVSIFMDKKDVLINFKATQLLTKRFKSWTLTEVNTDLAVVHKGSHHHLIDEFGMGNLEYQKMMSTILSKINQ